MKKTNPSKTELRQQAEAKLAERRKQTDPLPSMDVDVRRLVHELEVNQIELEMQNEELLQARAEREAALNQYTDLYDFAPIGYFTLARDGAISKVNLIGAKLLSVERSNLLKKRFGLFVADQFRAAFNDFLESVFESKTKESLNIVLGKKGGESRWVLIEATCSDDKQSCLAAITDITERKQIEDNLIIAKERAEESEKKLSSSLVDLELAQKIASIGNWLFDPEIGIPVWSDEIYNIYERDKKLGPPHVDEYKKIYGEEQYNIFINAFSSAMTNGENYDIVLKFISPNGHEKWVRAICQPDLTRKSDKGYFLQGTIQDITERKQAEAKLLKAKERAEKSETRFKAITENTPDHIVMHDRELKYTMVINPQLGLTEEDMLGKTDHDFLSKEEADTLVEAKKRVMESGEPMYFETSLISQAGKPEFFAGTYIPTFDEQSQPNGLIGYFRNVTESKQAKIALLDSEEKYKALYENAPLAYQSLNEDGSFRDINPTWLSTLGYTQAEVIGHSFADFLHPDFQSKFRKYFPEFKRRGYVSNVEYKIRHKEGHYLDISFEGCIGYNPDGSFRQTYCVFKDITEQKKAEEALRESEKLLKNAATTAKLGHFQIDLQTGEANWSEETFRIFERHPSEGAPTVDEYRSLVHHDDVEKLFQLYAEVIKELKPFDLIYRIRRPSGEIRHVHSLCDIERNPEGEGSKMLGTLQDITERQEAEEKLKNSEKRFRALFEQAGDYCMILDPHTEDGIPVIVDANEAAYKKHGYTREEFIGRPVADIDDEEGKRLVVERTQFIMSGEPFYVENIHVRQDGTTFPVSIHANRIDIEGEPSLIFTTEYDISERKQAEESSRKSEVALNKAQQVSHVGSWAWYPSSNRLEWSDEMFRIFGIEQNEFSGDLSDIMQKAIHPDDRAAVEESNLSVITDGKPIPLEYRIIRPDGVVRTVWAEAGELVLDEAGNPALLTGIVQDISERKQAAIELSQQKALFEAIFTCIPDAIVYTDIDRKVVGINPAFSSIFEFTMDDLAGKKTSFFYESLEEYEHQGRVRFNLTAAERTLPYEVNYRKKDGSAFPGETLGTAIKSTSGMVMGYIGVTRDITERKQAEEKLLESEERYRNLVENSPTGILACDAQGQITSVNPEMMNILGSPSNEATMAINLFEFKPLVKAGISASFKQVFNTGKPHQVEHSYTTKWDKNIQVMAHYGPIKDQSGKTIGVQANVQDITEIAQARIAIEKYAQHLETLNTVTAVLSTSLELEQVLALILSEIKQVLPFDSGAVFLSEKGELRVAAVYGIKSSMIGQVFSVEDELFQKIKQTSKALIVDTISADPRFRNWGQSGKLESWMGVPLIIRDSLIGFMTFDSLQPNAYSIEQAELALSFAAQAAQAIENARQFRDTQHRASQLASLHKIDQAITSSFDISFTLDLLLKHLLEQMQVDAAAVLGYKIHLQTLSFSQGKGFYTTALQQTDLRLGNGLAGKVALGQRPIFIPDLTESSEAAFSESPEFEKEGFHAYYGIPLIVKGELVGVLEIFHRSPLDLDSEEMDFLNVLAGQAAIAMDNSNLFKEIQNSNTKLVQAYDATIEGWARALELRDMETEGHSRRVVKTTMDLAKILDLREGDLVDIRRGALLHDIGKMGIPDVILQKPGKLSAEEWKIMQLHPVYAYDWLSPIDYLRPALDIPHYHHEKWDGTGYPDGLKGERIPLSARIFAIVDVWDALCSDRPYRKAWSEEKALTHIRAESGKHFDPRIVEAFMKVVAEGRLK